MSLPKLSAVLPLLNDFLAKHPEATIRGYEGQGGAWVVVEAGSNFSLEIQANDYEGAENVTRLTRLVTGEDEEYL